MRGKVAKSLRKKAEQLTIGRPYVEYEPVIKRRVLDDECTRYFYQQMKKMYKLGLIVR